MSVELLENFVGQMTVAELCSRTGRSIDELLVFCDGGSGEEASEGAMSARSGEVRRWRIEMKAGGQIELMRAWVNAQRKIDTSKTSAVVTVTTRRTPSFFRFRVEGAPGSEVKTTVTDTSTNTSKSKTATVGTGGAYDETQNH